MTKLIVADLDQQLLTPTGQLDQARLNQQLAALAKRHMRLGLLTTASYAKIIQLCRGISAPLVLICEGGAETIVDRVVRDEVPIDYQIWHSALEWLLGQRDFNTADVVLSGKLNAYTDTAAHLPAADAIAQAYPTVYRLKNLTSVSDLVYQIRLFFTEQADLPSLAQTFNGQFTGQLVAHPVTDGLAITAFDASYANAIDGVTSELGLSSAAVSELSNDAANDPLAGWDGPVADLDGYAAIDALIARND